MWHSIRIVCVTFHYCPCILFAYQHYCPYHYRWNCLILSKKGWFLGFNFWTISYQIRSLCNFWRHVIYFRIVDNGVAWDCENFFTFRELAFAEISHENPIEITQFITQHFYLAFRELIFVEKIWDTILNLKRFSFLNLWHHILFSGSWTMASRLWKLMKTTFLWATL